MTVSQHSDNFCTPFNCEMELSCLIHWDTAAFSGSKD